MSESMGRRIQVIVSAAGFLALSTSVEAFDGESAYFCAIDKLFECTANRVCIGANLPAKRIPPFIEVDPASGTVRSAGFSALEEEAQFTHYETLGERTLVQGIVGKSDPSFSELGWTLSVNNADGRMVLSAAGEFNALVGYGNCINK